MEEGSEERKRARKEEIEYKFDREGGGEVGTVKGGKEGGNKGSVAPPKENLGQRH